MRPLNVAVTQSPGRKAARGKYIDFLSLRTMRLTVSPFPVRVPGSGSCSVYFHSRFLYIIIPSSLPFLERLADPSPSSRANKVVPPHKYKGCYVGGQGVIWILSVQWATVDNWQLPTVRELPRCWFYLSVNSWGKFKLSLCGKCDLIIFSRWTILI